MDGIVSDSDGEEGAGTMYSLGEAQVDRRKAGISSGWRRRGKTKSEYG